MRSAGMLGFIRLSQNKKIRGAFSFENGIG